MSFEIAELQKFDRVSPMSHAVDLRAAPTRRARSSVAFVAQNQAHGRDKMMVQPKQLLMRTLTAAVVATAWTVSISRAGAQTEQSTPAPSEQAPNIPDQKLNLIAAALERVVSVRENYERKLKEAPTSDMRAHRR